MNKQIIRNLIFALPIFNKTMTRQMCLEDLEEKLKIIKNIEETQEEYTERIVQKIIQNLN